MHMYSPLYVLQVYYICMCLQLKSIFAPVVYIQEAAAHVRTGADTSAFIHCSDLIKIC